MVKKMNHILQNIIEYKWIIAFKISKMVNESLLEKYVGKYVNIHLTHPYKGENYLEGDLTSVTDDKVVISYKIKTRLVNAEVNRNDIDKARLAIKF